MSLLFLLFIFDKMEKFKERSAVVKALKQRKSDASCNTSIDDTVKEKRFWKSVVEIASLISEEFNMILSGSNR